MIQKLRKKLIIVLMAVVCLFMIGILLSLFITAKNDFERRSVNAFREPPAHSDTKPQGNPENIGMAIAVVRVDAQGSVTVSQNQIFYLTDDELKTIVATLSAQPDDTGLTAEYNLRFRRHVASDGSTLYFFSDTYVERNSLNSQILYSVIIGVGAIGLFLLVSILLSRWMVKPVERAWE